MIVNCLWLHRDFYGEREVSLEFWLLSSIIKQVFCQLECQTCHLTTKEFLNTTQCGNYTRKHKVRILASVIGYKNVGALERITLKMFSFTASYGMCGLYNVSKNICETIIQYFPEFWCVLVLVRGSQGL